jgi:acetyl/propionyl-CoA carboxylase alpha subunit
VFAGYGFMAEDETMVAALEEAGLNFIGPCSRTVHDAGLKDEAKRTALKAGRVRDAGHRQRHGAHAAQDATPTARPWRR